MCRIRIDILDLRFANIDSSHTLPIAVTGSVSDGVVRKYTGDRSKEALVAFATTGWQDTPPAFSPTFSPLGSLYAHPPRSSLAKASSLRRTLLSRPAAYPLCYNPSFTPGCSPPCYTLEHVAAKCVRRGLTFTPVGVLLSASPRPHSPFPATRSLPPRPIRQLAYCP
jgi:hypothetical protein